jgi:prepilin-type N-terminal cleavage/methylation domain-containing protein
VRTRAFTLLELLIVVALLATVAGGILITVGGAADSASLDLTRREMFELQEALVRFERETGDLPRTGRWALASDGGEVPDTSPAFAAWFRAPANLTQLYADELRDPATGAVVHTLPAFDPDNRRGWKGPYLQRSGEGDVVVGDALDPLSGLGDPGAGALLPPMSCVADPFEHAPLSSGHYSWTRTDGGSYPRHGRPYLFLVDPADPANTARIVTLGPDGAYGTSDDLQLEVRP